MVVVVVTSDKRQASDKRRRRVVMVMVMMMTTMVASTEGNRHFEDAQLGSAGYLCSVGISTVEQSINTPNLRTALSPPPAELHPPKSNPIQKILIAPKIASPKIHVEIRPSKSKGHQHQTPRKGKRVRRKASLDWPCCVQIALQEKSRNGRKGFGRDGDGDGRLIGPWAACPGPRGSG